MLKKTMSKTDRVANQHSGLCNTFWNHVLTGLMSKYADLTKGITCLFSENHFRAIYRQNKEA